MYCKYMELAGLKKQQLIFKNNLLILEDFYNLFICRRFRG